MSHSANVRPRMIGWTGHRTIPNLPAVRDTVRRLVEAITEGSFDATFDRSSNWMGIGSAAIGADLILAEACIQRGMPVRIVLPCSVDDMLAVTPKEHRSAVARICAACEGAPLVLHRIDIRPLAAEVLRAYLALGDPASLAKADTLRAQYPGLKPGPGRVPAMP